MKTLTEFSTLVLRNAAAARAAARATVGEAKTPVAAAPAPSEPPPEGGEPVAEGDAPAEPVEAAEGEAPAEVAVVADPLVEAVAASLSVPTDRVQRLFEALDIVGDQLEKVRLVRVYQGETGPHGAVSRGEFHYAIDRIASGGGARRDDRGSRDGGRGRDGGSRGGGGGGGGSGKPSGMFGGPGGDRKPRGLGSLKMGAKTEAPKDDDRGPRGEMPRAGIGWQLTPAPGQMGRGGGAGGPRRDRPDRPNDRPRGPRPPRLGPDGQPLPFEARGDRRPNDRGPRGPGGPGGPGGSGGPGGGGGDRGPRGPRPGGAPIVEHRGARPPRLGPDGQPLPPFEDRGPRLGPDGQPLPPKPRRDRKPIGPDASGNGPDGKPWDPERRQIRQAERQTPAMNEGAPPSVEGAGTETPATPAPTSSSGE